MACSHPSILAVCDLLCGSNSLMLVPHQQHPWDPSDPGNSATDRGLVSATAPALISCVQKSISAQVALSDGPV